MSDTKMCSTGHIAPTTAFGVDKHRNDGLNSRCRQCVSEFRRDRYLRSKVSPPTPSAAGKAERDTSRARLRELEERHFVPVVTGCTYVEPLSYSVFSEPPVMAAPRWHCPVGACSVDNK